VTPRIGRAGETALAALRASKSKPIARPETIPPRPWRNTLYRLRRRGYDIETFVPKNPKYPARYLLHNPRYTNGESAGRRVACMFSDGDLDTLADLLVERDGIVDRIIERITERVRQRAE